MINEKVKFSIVIPMYNAEKTIVKCVNSILGQSYNNFELIVIDDGSTDSCYQICNDIMEHSNIDFKLHKKDNGGVSSARNCGIDFAEGELIIFIDSDDYIEENYLRNILNAYEENKSDIVICGYRTCIQKEQQKMVVYVPKIIGVCGLDKIEKCMGEFVDKRFILSPWAKAYKNSIVKKYGIKFDTCKNIGEDLNFNLNYLKCIKSMQIIGDTSYCYCIREGESLVHNFGAERIINTEDLFNESLDFCEQMGWTCQYIFAKYYFKSHLNFIDSRIVNGDSKREVNAYIKEILQNNNQKIALKYINIRDMELTLYTILFTLESRSIIRFFCKIRIFIKKHVRGY